MPPTREPMDYNFRGLSTMDFAEIMEEYIRLAPFSRMITEKFEKLSKELDINGERLSHTDVVNRVAALRATINRWVPRPEGGKYH